MDRGLHELSVPGSRQRAVYGLFTEQNRLFIDLTAARAASYWSAYYRNRYAKLSDYPGQAVRRTEISGAFALSGGFVGAATSGSATVAM